MKSSAHFYVIVLCLRSSGSKNIVKFRTYALHFLVMQVHILKGLEYLCPDDGNALLGIKLEV